METIVRGADRRLVELVTLADKSLRTSFAGLDVDQIVPEIQSSLTALQITLDAVTIREYAEHIRDRASFELVLP